MMHDMGEVRNTEVIPSEAGSKNKKEKHYPSISLSSKQLPELKGKKFGDTIELHIKGEIGGIREDYDDKEEAEYEIKIKEADCAGKMSEKGYKALSAEEQDDEDEKDVMGKK